MKLTEKEITEASQKLALEHYRYLSDLSEELENVELLLEAQKGYAEFMLPYHKKIVRCS